MDDTNYFIKLTKTQLDIVKIALSNLIGTTQNEELRTAADGLFRNIMSGLNLEEENE